VTADQSNIRITQKSRFERLTGMPDRSSVLEVVNKLRALGSARQIADFLGGAGITGVKGVPGACPLAVYIEKQTGVRVSVGEDFMFIGNVMASANVYGPLHDFVREFDKGSFPELVEVAQ
jgi:hypothetical protein